MQFPVWLHCCCNGIANAYLKEVTQWQYINSCYPGNAMLATSHMYVQCMVLTVAKDFYIQVVHWMVL